jgi:hypothetical protein
MSVVKLYNMVKAVTMFPQFSNVDARFSSGKYSKKYRMTNIPAKTDVKNIGACL